MEITWDDIAGLKYAKETLQESVIWPLLRPDIFQYVDSQFLISCCYK